MSQPNTFRLAKAWGKHKAGAELAVLAPGEPVAPNAVDPRRAAQLLADGYIAAPKLAAEKKAPKLGKEA